MQEIGEYIETSYNRQRKQARLGYFSPTAYERKFHQKEKLNGNGVYYLQPLTGR